MLVMEAFKLSALCCQFVAFQKNKMSMLSAAHKKNSFFADQSRYVYENTRNDDIMSCQFGHIYVQLTWKLQLSRDN
jgi:hypothetical protein